MLEDKFWIWETLEEAMRTEVDKVSDAQLENIMCAYGQNFKGSELLWDYMLERVQRMETPSF